MNAGISARRLELLRYLESIGIEVNILSYPAHGSVEEGRALRGDMSGTFTKNLLLKDKKGRLFLIVAHETRDVDLRVLHARIGANGRLGFAPAEIVRRVLGVEPGAVTPLAISHDANKEIMVILDEGIMGDRQVNFHPLVNTESLGLSPSELTKFIEATGHRYLCAKLDT